MNGTLDAQQPLIAAGESVMLEFKKSKAENDRACRITKTWGVVR
jgi:hypothetical protein